MSHRAVFFDAGETLVYPHPSFPELLAVVLRKAGHPVDPAAVRDSLHVVGDEFTRLADEGTLWSSPPERSRAFWASIYRLLLADLGVPFTDAVADTLYAKFTDLSTYRLFPEALSVLQELKARGFVLGVVSNFEEWLERLLESLGVAALFDVRVISGIEGLEKPDPRIFRLALDRTGVAAEESVFVGDSASFDVAPAARLGMLAVLIDRRGRHPDHSGPRITSLEELAGVIESADAVSSGQASA